MKSELKNKLFSFSHSSVDAIRAEYYFAGTRFDIHIWALKNVPIRFEHRE